MIVSCEGESLKSKTRNYPVHHTQLNEESVTTTEGIRELYTTIGKTLTSPGALAGLINIATVFNAKAAKIKNRNIEGCWKVLLIPSLVCTYMGVAALPFFISNFPDFGTAYAVAAIVFPWIIFGPYFWLSTSVCQDVHQNDNSRINLLGFNSILPSVKYQTMSSTSCLKRTADPVEVIDEGTPAVMDVDESLTVVTEETLSVIEEIPDVEKTDYGACDYRIVGSAGDGFGFFPSQGSNKHLGENRSVLTQDIDLNIFINTLIPQKHNLIPIDGAEGFTWIKLSEEEKQQMKDPVIQACLLPASDNSGYFLSAARISREATQYFPKDNGGTQVIEHFPALTVVAEGLGPNGTQIYEVDYAFALRYQGWPDAAAEWVTRERFGVDSKTIQQIANRGCYLVHKQCGHNKVAHEHDFDWRYTFAAAEADLFHYHQNKQALKLCFVILKFMIKMYMKAPGFLESLVGQSWILFLCRYRKNTTDRELPVLRTYHLKTIFLWMAEEETDLDYYTIKGNKTLDEVFMKILGRYLDCVSSGVLPNYFMRDRNMLAGGRYQPKDITDGAALLRKIQRKPAWAIQNKFEGQFINKKALMTLIVIGLVVLSTLQYISTLSNATTDSILRADIEPTMDFDDIIYDFSTKYFSSGYLVYLKELYAKLTQSKNATLSTT